MGRASGSAWVVALLTLVYAAGSEQTKFRDEMALENPANAWERFLREPNRVNYESCRMMIILDLWNQKVEPTKALQEQLFDESPDRYIAPLGSGYRYISPYAALYKLVTEANPYAADLMMLVGPFTDGAYAEDLREAIGLIVRRDPELFLILLRRYGVSENDGIREYLMHFPLDEVLDDLKAEKAEAKRRFQALEKVQNKDLIPLRDTCLSILQTRLKEYDSLKEEPEEPGK